MKITKAASLYPWQIWEDGTLMGVFKTRREAQAVLSGVEELRALSATRWWDRPADHAPTQTPAGAAA